MNKLDLHQLARIGGENFCTFLLEAEDKIEDAIDVVREEARSQETKPKLRVGFTVVVDLDSLDTEFTLGFATRFKLSATQTLDDSAQQKLDLDRVEVVQG